MRKQSAGVFICQDLNFPLPPECIRLIIDEAHNHPRRRARICIHNNTNSCLHEMILAKLQDTYVRPHKNLNKIKSIHVLEGKLTLVLFDNGGKITHVTHLEEYGSPTAPSFFRLGTACFHTLIINSPYAVFKETITGPFNPSDTLYAQWSPEEGPANHGNGYLHNLRRLIDDWS